MPVLSDQSQLPHHERIQDLVFRPPSTFSTRETQKVSAPTFTNIPVFWTNASSLKVNEGLEPIAKHAGNKELEAYLRALTEMDELRGVPLGEGSQRAKSWR